MDSDKKNGFRRDPEFALIMIYLKSKKKLIGVHLWALFTDHKSVLLEVKCKKDGETFYNSSAQCMIKIIFVLFWNTKKSQLNSVNSRSNENHFRFFFSIDVTKVVPFCFLFDWNTLRKMIITQMMIIYMVCVCVCVCWIIVGDFFFVISITTSFVWFVAIKNWCRRIEC